MAAFFFRSESGWREFDRTGHRLPAALSRRLGSALAVCGFSGDSAKKSRRERRDKMVRRLKRSRRALCSLPRA